MNMRTVLTLVACLKIAGIVWMSSYMYVMKKDRLYTYEGDDHPQQWPGVSQEIQKHRLWVPLENSVRFSFKNDSAGESEANWDSQVPHDGIIYLGDKKQSFSVSVFHQLSCINIIRRETLIRQSSNYTTPIPALTSHCLNYLRQMALCRSDLHLTKLSYLGPELLLEDVQLRRQCLDMSLVYDALEKNHQSSK